MPLGRTPSGQDCSLFQNKSEFQRKNFVSEGSVSRNHGRLARVVESLSRSLYIFCTTSLPSEFTNAR